MDDSHEQWRQRSSARSWAALAGYLFFTDRGRALRRQIEPALEDFARELSSFRGTVAEGGRRRQRRVEAAERSARRKASRQHAALSERRVRRRPF